MDESLSRNFADTSTPRRHVKGYLIDREGTRISEDCISVVPVDDKFQVTLSFPDIGPRIKSEHDFDLLYMNSVISKKSPIRNFHRPKYLDFIRSMSFEEQNTRPSLAIQFDIDRDNGVISNINVFSANTFAVKKLSFEQCDQYGRISPTFKPFHDAADAYANARNALDYYADDSLSHKTLRRLLVAGAEAMAQYTEQEKLAVLYTGRRICLVGEFKRAGVEFVKPHAYGLYTDEEMLCRALQSFGVTREDLHKGDFYLSTMDLKFSTEPLPHISTNGEPYVSVSAPLRKQCDLINALQLSAHLRGVNLPFSPDEIGIYARKMNKGARSQRSIFEHRVLRENARTYGLKLQHD